MDESSAQAWYLRKHEDGSVFGPLTIEQLERWAASAQIAPHDSVSADQINWTKAPMVPQLGMDWLVEVTSERYYGPTTLGAIQEFVRLGDIDGETFIIDSCSGNRVQIQQVEGLLEGAAQGIDLVEQPNEYVANEPEIAGISIAVQDRIRDLEQSLAEERRASHELEQHYLELERRYRELEERVSPGSGN